MRDFIKENLREITIQEPTETVDVTEPTESVALPEQAEQIDNQDITDDILSLPAEEVIVEKQKKVIDLKDWVEQNNTIINEYLKEKNTNYDEMPLSDLAFKKLSKDFNNLSEDDIREELEDKYAIGLEKIDINDEDALYDSGLTLQEAKKYNSEIDKKQRLLKRDAPEFLSELKKYKETLSIPSYETDFEEKKINEDDVFSAKQKELIEKDREWRDTEWKNQLHEAIKDVPKLSKKIEFEHNGNKVVVDAEYFLNDDDKQNGVEYLKDYIISDSDMKNYQDVQGFATDKLSQKNYDKLLQTAVKQAYMKGIKDYVSNNVINYDDTPKSVSSAANNEEDFASRVFANSARKRRLG